MHVPRHCGPGRCDHNGLVLRCCCCWWPCVCRWGDASLVGHWPSWQQASEDCSFGPTRCVNLWYGMQKHTDQDGAVCARVLTNACAQDI